MQKESRGWGEWLRQEAKMCVIPNKNVYAREMIGLLLLRAPTITFWSPASTTHPTLWIFFALFLGIPRHCYSTFGTTSHNLGSLQSPEVSLSALSASPLLSLIIHAIPGPLQLWGFIAFI